MPTPVAGPEELRVKVAWSGVNPSDVKSRAGNWTQTMPFPRIIPHSDGVRSIDQVGPGVSSERLGKRVWVWNAAWMRPFGTAAQYTISAGTVDIVALSALLTTMPSMKTTIEPIEQVGLRNRVKIIVGGAPVTQGYANQIGADGFTADASSAPSLAQSLL